MHAVDDVLPAVVVQAGQWRTEARALARGEAGHVQWAAALGGKIKLLTTARDASTDVHLGLTVVYGDVNVVNASVQDRVQDALGLIECERPAYARDHAAQLQRAEAEGGHV